MNTGQYGGIGAITREIGKRTVVTMIMEGYGAQKGGLKIGDEVLKIDDVDLSIRSKKPVCIANISMTYDQPFT